MLLNIYDLGDHIEATATPTDINLKKKDQTHEANERKKEVHLKNIKMKRKYPHYRENDLYETKNTYVNHDERVFKDEINRERSIRRTKVMLRRYIKKYGLTKMYTFTFAENLPMSKQAERCGKWTKRLYKGKLRDRWEWTTEPEGERIENGIYYNPRYKVEKNLSDYKDAWYLWKKFIRRLQAAGIDFSYLVVPEKQKNGRVHFHVATNRTTDSISSIWKYGFIGYPTQSGTTIRSSCIYLTKYIAKSIDDDGGRSGVTRRYRRSEYMSLTRKQERSDSDPDVILSRVVDTFGNRLTRDHDISIFEYTPPGMRYKTLIIHITRKDE